MPVTSTVKENKSTLTSENKPQVIPEKFVKPEVIRPSLKPADKNHIKNTLASFKAGNLKQALFDGQEPFLDKCPVCDKKKLQYLGILNYFEYFRCIDCGTFINLQLLPYKITPTGDKVIELFRPIYDLDDMERYLDEFLEDENN